MATAVTVFRESKKTAVLFDLCTREYCRVPLPPCAIDIGTCNFAVFVVCCWADSQVRNLLFTVS
jgi:hypothetical protein